MAGEKGVKKKDSDSVSPVNYTLPKYYCARVRSFLFSLSVRARARTMLVFACVMPEDIRAVIEWRRTQTAAQCHSQLRAPSLHSAPFAL